MNKAKHNKSVSENECFNVLSKRISDIILDAWRMGFNYGFDMALWLDENAGDDEEVGQRKKFAEV